MKYSVLTFPGLVLCGKCGHALRQDGEVRNGEPARLECFSYDCERRDIVLLLPVTVIELEQATE